MTPRARRRGFTVLETVVGLAIATIVVSAAWEGGRVPAMAATRSLDRLQDLRAATSALERLDRATVSAGSSSFDPHLPHATGHVVVREVEPGLFEVAASVARPGLPAVSVTTRVLREAPR